MPKPRLGFNDLDVATCDKRGRCVLSGKLLAEKRMGQRREASNALASSREAHTKCRTACNWSSCCSAAVLHSASSENWPRLRVWIDRACERSRAHRQRVTPLACVSAHEYSAKVLAVT